MIYLNFGIFFSLLFLIFLFDLKSINSPNNIDIVLRDITHGVGKMQVQTQHRKW